MDHDVFQHKMSLQAARIAMGGHSKGPSHASANNSVDSWEASVPSVYSNDDDPENIVVKKQYLLATSLRPTPFREMTLRGHCQYQPENALQQTSRLIKGIYGRLARNKRARRGRQRSVSFQSGNFRDENEWDEDNKESIDADETASILVDENENIPVYKNLRYHRDGSVSTLSTISLVHSETTSSASTIQPMTGIHPLSSSSYDVHEPFIVRDRDEYLEFDNSLRDSTNSTTNSSVSPRQPPPSPADPAYMSSYPFMRPYYPPSVTATEDTISHYSKAEFGVMRRVIECESVAHSEEGAFL